MTVRLDTEIRAATVYRNGALITRRGTLTAAALASAGADPVLLLPGLPLLFAADSLRLRVDGAGLRAGPLEEAAELFVPPSPSQDARDRLDDLRRRRRAVKAELSALVQAREAWTRLDVAALPGKASERPAGLPAVASWLALLDLSAEGVERLTAAERGLQAKLRGLASEIALAEAALRVPVSAKPGRTLRAQLHRADKSGGDAEVTLEYFVTGARWAPVYEVHINTRAQRARLVLGAQLAQATGEDWESVAVSASTIDLKRDGVAPKLDSWRIGRHAPPASDWRPLPDDLDELFTDYDALLRDRPSAPPPPPDDDEDDDGEGGEVFETGAAPPPPESPASRPGGVPMPSAPPPPQMQAAAMPQAPMADVMRSEAKSRGGLFGSFGGGGGSRQRRPANRPAPAAAKAAGRRDFKADEDDDMGMELGDMDGLVEDITLSPDGGGVGGPSGEMLDYAWLRLSAPDDRRRRGRLLPVGLLSDLRAFVEARGGDTSQIEALKRAMAGLRRDVARLQRASLPPGCVSLKQSSYHHRYPAGPAVDLPSDGQFRRVTVLEAEGGCQLRLRAVPRQDDRVFRFALLANPTQRPLLAGPLQVYLDGEFMVTSQLASCGAGETLALNLGVEERVRIARNTEYSQSEHGMFTSTSRLDHAVSVEARSTLPAPATLELFERLPVVPKSLKEEIAVELDSTTPPVSARNRDAAGAEAEGALRWDLALLPGKMIEVRYRYTIDISARKELVGGNRREP